MMSDEEIEERLGEIRSELSVQMVGLDSLSTKAAGPDSLRYEVASEYVQKALQIIDGETDPEEVEV